MNARPPVPIAVHAQGTDAHTNSEPYLGARRNKPVLRSWSDCRANVSRGFNFDRLCIVTFVFRRHTVIGSRFLGFGATLVSHETVGTSRRWGDATGYSSDRASGTFASV